MLFIRQQALFEQLALQWTVEEDGGNLQEKKKKKDE